MYLAEYSGKGVCIAVIDSGVHAAHPHVGGVSGGVAIRADGTLDEDFVDRLGHGTAVTAAIREKAPAADIIAIKVFWRDLPVTALWQQVSVLLAIGIVLFAIARKIARRWEYS